MAKRNQAQEEQTRIERDMQVYKRDDMIQRARYDLTIQEQRCILYAISKIKPTDQPDAVYTFNISDFYSLCGLQTDSYTKLKRIVKTLADKSWWIDNGKGGETLVRWFAEDGVNITRGSISLQFSRRMAPYVMELAAQGKYYTGYGLLYVLPMKRQYSPRLYELLKSYEKNNREWYFELATLRRLLDCENHSYDRFYNFRVWVLDPAVEEINKYTDLNIAYTVQKENRKPNRIIFTMVAKDWDELTQTKLDVDKALDGQIDIDSFMEMYRKEKEQDAQRRFEELNQEG